MLNEHNYVVGYKIVPDDTRKHVGEVLKDIFSVCEGSPSAVFTDNAHKDKGVIREAFEEYYDGNILVLQVLSFAFTKHAYLLRTYGMLNNV